MSGSNLGKNNWALFLMILAGIGQSFGLNNPIVLDLGIIVLTFGLTIKITIGGIIGVIIGVVIYKLL